MKDSIRLYGIVEKGWGSENIWISNDYYCSKFLNFNAGAEFSMHYHAKKVESWFVLSGYYKLVKINTKDASISEKLLLPGHIVHNEPNVPHKLICITSGTVLEVSTPDSIEDNYRVLPGSSQK